MQDLQCCLAIESSLSVNAGVISLSICVQQQVLHVVGTDHDVVSQLWLKDIMFAVA